MPQSQVQSEIRNRIHGWGADLDPANRPAVPMERTPPRYTHADREKIKQQPVRVKLFKSIERPDITPIFGTSAPPKGLSGMIRGYAFRFSENDVRHWYLLVLADRINMVEGIFEDLSRGHIPNFYKEIGGPAEFKYNRAGFYKKTAIAAGVIGAISFLLISRSRKRRLAEA
jgi:hypothetical protein